MLHNFANRARFVLASILLLVAGLALASCQASSSGTGTAASAGATPSLAEFRAQNGLPALRPDRDLERLALAHSAQMASTGRMVHNTGWRRDFPSRMRAGGISGAAAENIAHGRFDAARVMGLWMNSAGHRRNMLDARFSRFGLASAPDPRDPSRRYWTMVLGE